LNENQYKVVLFDLGTKDIVSANSFVEIPEHLQQVNLFFQTDVCLGYGNS